MVLPSDEVEDTPEALTRALKEAAPALGFVRTGVALAGPLEPEGSRLRKWIEDGRHGEMGWMADTLEVRENPRHTAMLAGAASVVVMVTPYARGPGGPVGPEPGRVARYARGRDYHNVVHKRGKKLASILTERGYRARVSVDLLPVFERAWAERAGVGFIGKNCCLIVPGMGSHVFLSCIVTTAELVPDQPMKERCGSCRLCLDACPTDAFVEARQMDARRCISYLSIEHRGPIDVLLRKRMGDWLFGCDVCQDVCPYNRTSPPPEELTDPFRTDETRWSSQTAESLLGLDKEAFKEWAEGSPVRRAGVIGMARNAAIVLGNVGQKRHLPVLRDAAREHPSAVVREAASWAVGRIGERKYETPKE